MIGHWFTLLLLPTAPAAGVTEYVNIASPITPSVTLSASITQAVQVSAPVVQAITILTTLDLSALP